MKDPLSNTQLLFVLGSIRHTFATRCYEKGMREKVIQKILGHSKLDMTLNVYTHVTDEMIEEDIKKLEETKEDMGKPEE